MTQVTETILLSGRMALHEQLTVLIFLLAALGVVFIVIMEAFESHNNDDEDKNNSFIEDNIKRVIGKKK